ncbi:MAG: hypothetical protein IPL01_24720 [Acidobacteria bacterium]|nr:hypothetical protein [Acidobacteriota bacterium]
MSLESLKSSQKYRDTFNQTVLLITLTTIVSLTAIAQSPDKILKNAVKAMGGEKALRSIKSWRVKGTITDLRTRCRQLHGSRPAAEFLHNVRTFDMRGLETSVGYSGRSGWMRDSRDGLRTLTGLYSRDFQAEVAWRNNRWLDYKKEKAKTALAGPVTIGEKSASSIALTTSKNVRIKMYFDTGTGLLIREELPAAETTRIFDYSDFRPVNGVMEPHEIRVTEGESKFFDKAQEITHNSQLNKALFDFPTISNEPLPDIPMLLKQVGENEDEIDSILEKYTYTETITRREIDSKGEVKDKDSEKFELTFTRGNRLRRQIEKNGKPLSSGDDADETKRLKNAFVK